MMQDNIYTDVPMYMKTPNKLAPVDVVPHVETGVRYRWSFAAKVVACTNMFLGCCTFLFLFTSTIIFSCFSVKLKRGNLDHEYEEMIPDFHPEKDDYYIVVGSLAFFIAFVLNNVEFMMAYLLQRGATMVAPPHQILKKCLIWRNVSIILLSLYSATLIFAYDLWYVWLAISFRLVCFVLGCLFIWDVKKEARKLELTKEKYAETAQDIVEMRSFR